MSRIRADEYSNRLGTGAPIFTEGVNVTGVVTATSFSGDGSNLTGVGVGTEDNINTSGIVTASKFVGAEFEGSGDKLIFSPTITSFSPTDGATGVNALSNPDISITYNQPVIIGSGVTITLRKDSASGTIVESYEVGVSTRATASGQTLTIDPTDNFDYDQEYYVVIPQGGITNYVGGNSSLLDTYNFTTEAGPVVTSVTPGFGSTSVGISTNVVFTYDKNIRAGVGTITLRTVSAAGTITESYDVSSSGRLTFSTNTLTIDPTSDLELNTNYYVVVPDDAVAGYTGISTYEFTTEDTLLGTALEGGYLICQASSVQWIVAPAATEVSRNWHSRNDAVTTANASAACGDWFVPTCGQLQNPGYTCRTYWDSCSSAYYWSSTECNGTFAWIVYFTSGNTIGGNKSGTGCVRALRCVSY